MEDKVRIQKYLSQQGLYSRREAEELIKSGKVQVNGVVTKNLATKIDPSEDRIKVGGKAVIRKDPPKVYWMLHKPDSVLTAAKGQAEKPCIFDLPKLRKLSFKVASVGRLDYRTEGLLLLSNDGDLVFKLSHPKFKVPRTYQVMISKRLTDEEEAQVRKGVKLKDGPVEKIMLKYGNAQKIGKTRGYWYEITVFEGRNRLVRRIVEHMDARVIRLVRTGFGDLQLDDDLKPGHYRQLTNKEISYLRNSVEV